jgi:ATP-dependent exoDNAse (exonuclease V) beta subunit
VGYEPGTKPKVAPQPPQIEKTIAAEHVSDRAALQPVSGESIGLYERKRGEFIHAILAKLEFVDNNPGEQLRRTVEEIQAESREGLESAVVEQLFVGFLQVPDVREFFLHKEGRKILNEQEFARPDGRLFRMDRLVVDAESVTVIDFKTGNEDPEYAEQVRSYVDILHDVYPRHAIRGFLAYVDRTLVREILPKNA